MTEAQTGALTYCGNCRHGTVEFWWLDWGDTTSDAVSPRRIAERWTNYWREGQNQFLGWAQGGPGTIKGMIKDGETGDLLDYANVIIKGTTRGTMSLGGGAFFTGLLRYIVGKDELKNIINYAVFALIQLTEEQA